MIILSPGVAVPIFAAADFNCQVLTVPTLVRAEGMTEPVGDIVLSCTGGTPTPAGQPVPQVNITVLFNATVTTRMVASGQFTEALLLVDEPVSTIHPTQPLLNCGNTEAPDNGDLGPGVCSIVSTGDPGSTYDATPNGYGAATCDGTNGRPGANSYGCGRPNAFQGQLGTPQSPGQLNAITFFNVPLDPPGEAATRTLRITNIRANVVPLGPAPPPSAQTEVVALVTVTGSLPVSLLPFPDIGAATVLPGLTPCQPTLGSRIRICEGFQTIWKPKNISFLTGDHAGIAGNATVNDSSYSFTGTANYPADVAQNVTGVNYGTESLFEWQNNGANAPPSPDPPFVVAGIQANNYPLNSAGLGGLNTGINLDGIANAGTRLAVQFLNIPTGASVQVPPLLYIFPTNSSSYNGDPTQYQSGATGVMALTQTDSSGAGAYSPITTPLTLTPASNLAVYEILWADPNSAEFTEVPYTILNASPDTQLQTSVVFAPFYTDSSSAQASVSAPVPRFENGLCLTSNCVQISPDQAPNTGVSTVTFTAGFSLTGAQVKLTGTGVPDIPGTGVSNPPAPLSNPTANVLSANFDFTGAALGTRDVVLTPASGPPITIPGGFAVVAATCTFTVSPQNTLLPVGGGTAYLDVEEFDPSFFDPIDPSQPPASRCGAISASTATSWITLQPVLPSYPLAQAFSAAPNTSASPRTGSITLAGQTVNVTQDGTNTCTYSISPGGFVFDPAGGTAQVMVTAPAGCSWDFTANAPGWITFMNGSGSGNGTVTIIAAANTSFARTATLLPMPYGSIPSFLATQNGAGCSASPVSAPGPISGTGGELVINVPGLPNCSYAAGSNVPWITVDSPWVLGGGLLDLTVDPNPEPTPRTGTIIASNTTLTIVQEPAAGLQFVPITPCRVVDTRNANGPFGGPLISTGTTRSFTIPSGSCGIPATAQAYSLNVAVVPSTVLGYLTVWPTGQMQPQVATLNSLDGRIKSNAAIVPAGTNGAVSVYSTNDTQVILDINGYFVPASTAGALAFYPVTPCRLVDTRINLLTTGALTAGSTRTLPLLSSTCNLPVTAQAYSLNFTVVPPGPIGYLTAWATGQAQPVVATLNDLTGTIVANAAIVAAGAGGSINVYSTNNTDLVVDLNGYFAPTEAEGLSLYALPPCRVLDTRQAPISSTIIGEFDVNVLDGCGGTPSAQAYVFNATVVPSGPLGYLTMWPQGTTRPTVATLNALDGAITNNMAIVPTNNTEISAYATNPTYLILDLFGYFAP